MNVSFRAGYVRFLQMVCANFSLSTDILATFTISEKSELLNVMIL